jgi:hypothetical protein
VYVGCSNWYDWFKWEETIIDSINNTINIFLLVFRLYFVARFVEGIFLDMLVPVFLLKL